jgi:hypothetical protein
MRCWLPLAIGVLRAVRRCGGEVMASFDYWDEAVACSFDECGIVATEEQIKRVAADMQVSHECYGMCFPTPELSHPRQETERLRRELEDERRKVMCRECGGSGSIVSHGPCHSAISQCSKCRGDGRHLP